MARLVGTSKEAQERALAYGYAEAEQRNLRAMAGRKIVEEREKRQQAEHNQEALQARQRLERERRVSEMGDKVVSDYMKGRGFSSARGKKEPFTVEDVRRIQESLRAKGERGRSSDPAKSAVRAGMKRSSI